MPTTPDYEREAFISEETLRKSPLPDRVKVRNMNNMVRRGVRVEASAYLETNEDFELDGLARIQEMDPAWLAEEIRKANAEIDAQPRRPGPKGKRAPR